MNKKVFVLGIDSIAPDLLLGLVRDGRLPALSSLMENATWTYTDNEPGLSETIWTNFYTGVNPARHGRYFNAQIVPGSYRTRIFRPSVVKAPPYWNRLSAAQKQVIIVDVPKTAITGPINGIQINNWALHDQELDSGFTTWPPALADQLDGRYGTDTVRPNDYGGNGPVDFGAYRDALVANINRKTRLATDFIKKMDWDHFLLVYDDGHALGHHAWHLHDTDHPEYRSDLHAAIGDPLEDICTALDSALQKILDTLDDTCIFALFVSHGIGPNYHASYILDEILRRLQGDPRGRGKPVNPLRKVWRSIPVKFHDRLMPLQDALRNILLVPDRRRRKAFALPASDDAGVIRINVQGREPGGLVAPGPDYESYCGWLEQGLMELRNADTGEPVVDHVARVDDYCEGPYRDHLPDLIVHWKRDNPIRAVNSPRVGTITMPTRNRRYGIHTTKGLFIASGTSSTRQTLAEPVRLLDLAPTICSWLGVDLEQTDGQVISEFVTD